MFLKIEFSDLSTLKKSFQSSVTTDKSDYISIIIDHLWQYYWSESSLVTYGIAGYQVDYDSVQQYSWWNSTNYLGLYFLH